MFTFIRTAYWKCFLTLKGAKVGKNFTVQGPLEILLRDNARYSNITIGDNVTLGGKVYLRIRKNGRITLEDGVKTGTEVWLVGANDEELRVGRNSILGSYSIFNGGHGLAIGEDCVLAAFVYANSSDHKFKKGTLIREQGFQGEPIRIGNDVWVGGHVFINKGVSIGDGCVIGAGSIVTKDIEGNKIAVGNPAKVIRDRE